MTKWNKDPVLLILPHHSKEMGREIWPNLSNEGVVSPGLFICERRVLKIVTIM